jgi:hypothetical protein
MGINTLPASYILRKHNLEMYLTKKIEPLVPFLNLLPLADNDTGEFATVLDSPTAKEDMDNGVLSEPLEVTEGSELTDVELSPINATLGKTSVVGYQFKYTKQFLKRQDSDARIALATSKIIAGMAHKLNAICLNGIVESAGAAFPSGLSDWDTAIDPRSDAIKLRSAFNSGSAGDDDLPFELDTCFISNTKHVKLQDYYMSFDKDFNNKSIDVDGTNFENIKNAFNGITGVDLVGIDSTIPCGIIEKYVDPDYSTIRQAELSDAQSNLQIPQSLLNVNLVEPRKIEEPYIYQIVAEMGFSSQEPKGAVKGAL